MTKPLIPVLLLLGATAALAGPAPFGLELGQTTQGQAGTRYPLRPVGINALTLGEQFDLDGRLLPVAGLKTVRLIFGPDRRLLGVIAVFAPERYADVRAELAAKYRQVPSAAPAAAGQYDRFTDGDSEIALSKPSGAPSIKLDYIHRRLSEAVRIQRQQAAEASPL